MKIVDGTGYRGEFSDSPTLSAYADANERISQVLGSVDRLLISENDDLTVFDFGTIVVKGGTLRAFGSGTVYATGGVVYAHDEVRVLAFGSAKVTSHGRASVIACDKALVTGYEDCRITLRAYAQATLHDNCRGSFHNLSQASLHDMAQGYAYDMAVVDIHGDYATLRARGLSRVEVHGTPSVWLGGNSVAHTSPETRVKFIAVTGNARVTAAPMTKPADVSLEPSPTPTRAYQEGGSPEADRATVAAASISASSPQPQNRVPDRAPSSDTQFPATEDGSPTSKTTDTEKIAGEQDGLPLADFGPEWRPLPLPRSQ
ncbi:hypothetical protein [Rhodococcus pyridinivorans]|uniref:hypothetical protein n=1 Tax=Rhodococcus pyridinivorans TaxID=103816 RepID=UPI0026585044|nr:hypothetical protein [Rhodococcus pyridinivorans]